MDAASSVAEARAALTAAGQLPDAELDLAGVALQFARIDAPEADWRAAAAHLSDLARQTVTAAAADSQADAGDPLRRAELLASVLARFGYEGDETSYDDPANANLIRVTQRRRGLPVALGLLWLHIAEAAGWPAHGLDFPGHFLLGVEGRRGVVVVDPFHGGLVLEAPALRMLLKRIEGEQAELRPGVLASVGKRAVLLRLQNNIKLRRLHDGALDGALACTEDMLRLAPDAAALWREAAVMNQRLDRIGKALTCLDRFLALVPEGEAAARARAMATELRQRLN
ncbi:SirB1 family protein [Roseomonas marmotae]|uniref:Transglutaminase family protein n=1 Tax=Roseomonas marmotae TaxID=2768161 RepID=A0ABS3K883_9PROT|nr:transglutaminase-like domain-containing protein [Roseomonas marmotae]MBO1073130.1 transglutaminase family protein [Roseomonas marmotae]QTI79234.1 transglutaminase family protein [Roseomonas marmotae]